MDDSRILIIKENGDIDIIFSSKDNSADNLLTLKENENVNKVFEYEKSIKGKTYQNKEIMERHLIYMKEYLKDHFVEEFKRMKINPAAYSSDVYLYYFLSELNNVVLINSGAHHNILVVPNVGMNEKELESLEKIKDIFPLDTYWDINEDMHFEIIEEHGQKYKILNIGEPSKYNLEEYIQACHKKENKTL